MFCCLSVVVGRRKKAGNFNIVSKRIKKKNLIHLIKCLEQRNDVFTHSTGPIDYNRKSVPEELFDIIVPFYPELQDIILIRGDDPHPWLAKVVRIQDRAQTVRVLYYENDPTRPGQDLFLPNNTRLAYDYVPWNSIIGLALGEWQGNAWQLF